MQVKAGKYNSPLTIPRDGTIVAWTISLSLPTASQIAYFDKNEGGPSEAGIAILKNTKGLGYQLVGSSPLVQLQPFFGEKAQFALTTTIPVKKGERIGLTVPTWAPALAIKLSHKTSWRPAARRAPAPAPQRHRPRPPRPPPAASRPTTASTRPRSFSNGNADLNALASRTKPPRQRRAVRPPLLVFQSLESGRSPRSRS